MSEEKKFICPQCGALISEGDKICKNCGTLVSEAGIPEEKPEIYQRKFALTQRLYKLLISPKDAMMDISRAPEYAGVFVIIIIQAILAVRSIVPSIIAVALLIDIVSLILGWLILSLIVKYLCDSGSGWDYRTAASVTGYARLPGVILGLIGLFVTWFAIPSVSIYTLPVSVLSLILTSYLGGLGAYFGTMKKCSLGKGIAVFFVLGLVGLIIAFILAIPLLIS